jgi:hypothetical protein
LPANFIGKTPSEKHLSHNGDAAKS